MSVVPPVLPQPRAFARVVVLDPHGTGASDPMPGGSLPTVEDWSDDIRAVLDAVGIDRAAVVGLGGFADRDVFSATHPARTSALVLVNGSHFRTDGMTPEAREALIEFASSGWGSVELGRLIVPSATEAERELLARHHRQLASPARAHTMMRMQLETDVRDALPLIQCRPWPSVGRWHDGATGPCPVSCRPSPIRSSSSFLVGTTCQPSAMQSRSSTRFAPS